MRDWYFVGNHSLGLLTEFATVTFQSVELAELSGPGKPSPKPAKQ
jgi:hypothetical protein